jgi:aspartate/glutamate racemase
MPYPDDMAQSSPPRIALIHALRASMGPTDDAFARGWPDADTFSLLDDSLSRDLAAGGARAETLPERFRELGRYAVRCGADAILFTCSAFGEAIDGVRDDVRVPVLKPNEAMIDEALGLPAKVALLATFAPTLPSMSAEFDAEAARQGRHLDLTPVHVAGALEALQRGEPERHDGLIVEAANRLAGPHVIVLAQFSMARAADAVRAETGMRTLTTPESAVARLRDVLGA